MKKMQLKKTETEQTILIKISKITIMNKKVLLMGTFFVADIQNIRYKFETILP